MLPYMPESEMSKAGILVDELDKKLESDVRMFGIGTFDKSSIFRGDPSSS